MIQQLRDKISAVAAVTFQKGSFGATDHMSKALAAVRKNFDNPGMGGPAQGKTIAEAVAGFRSTGMLSSFIDAKYICIGLCHYLSDDWRLIDDTERFVVLLEQVRQAAVRPRMLLRCYQGLLYNYFNFAVHIEDASGKWADNWTTLRDFLQSELKTVQQVLAPPTWLQMLAANENLLGEDPCRKYGNVLAEGGQKEFKEICDTVGIQSGSWLLEEAVFSQIEAVCSYGDAQFADKIDELVLLLVGHGRESYSKRLLVRCLAALVIRYSRSREHPDHRMLRDTLIRHIGNPWLNKPAWYTSIGDESARLMVDGWLKCHLIHDFFTLLSEDGASDKRRLDYWLRFDGKIDDLWFVLGKDARSNSSSDFKEIRALAKDHLLSLDGGGACNNAFIMKIGSKYAVEFGINGNACYIFDEDRLPFDLTRRRSYNAADLRSKELGKQLIHKDGYQRWESKFDDYLSQRIGWRPVTPAHSGLTGKAQSTYDRITNHHGLRYETGPLSELGYRDVMQMVLTHSYGITDNRSRDGGLWVDAPDNVPDVSSILTSYGFSFRHGKGWYRE